MQRYKIIYKNFDMPEDFTSSTIKWAHNSKDAVKLITKKAPDRNKCCTLKRGSQAKIIDVIEL